MRAAASQPAFFLLRHGWGRSSRKRRIPPARGFAPSVRLSLSGTALQSYEASHGQAQYQWFFGTLDGCPLRFAFGATSHVRACGFGEVGVLRVGAAGFDHLQAHSSGWGALGLLGRGVVSWVQVVRRCSRPSRFALNHPTYLVQLGSLVDSHPRGCGVGFGGQHLPLAFRLP